jgi:N-acyl-D-amino-acid deacylase
VGDTGSIDLAITGGDVVDGSGAPRYRADIAVSNGRIVAIGSAASWRPTETIDATGLAVCPGFIDVHTHDDQALFDDPLLPAKVSQGVTTVIAGNCGVSLAPLVATTPPPAPLTEVADTPAFRFATFAAYLDALEAAPPAVNAACFVGHTTLRAAVMTDLSRPASVEERRAMAAKCQEALEAGAIGVSSGLFYPPAFAAPADEVTELVALAGKVGGVYAAHIRDESDAVEAAIDEAVEIAMTAGAPLVISHHKVSGAKNFGRSRATLAKIAHAATCHCVGFDVYPYAASSTMLNEKSWSAATKTLVTWSKPYPEFAGLALSEAAARLGLGEREALTALSPGGGVYFMMDEGDVQRILSAGAAMIGSDGVPNNVRPHPRLWGSFTRVLGHYVREVKLFGFEEAVRRMTGLPASQFRLRDRGVLVPGAIADITLVDPETVADRATFAEPTRASAGIEGVFVGGVRVWADGAPTGARPGRVLRRGAPA